MKMPKLYRPLLVLALALIATHPSRAASKNEGTLAGSFVSAPESTIWSFTGELGIPLGENSRFLLGPAIGIGQVKPKEAKEIDTTLLGGLLEVNVLGDSGPFLRLRGLYNGQSGDKPFDWEVSAGAGLKFGGGGGGVKVYIERARLYKNGTGENVSATGVTAALFLRF